MGDQKVFIITNDNGRYEDMIIGDENLRQVALSTKDYIEKRNDLEWTKYRVVELPLEGKIHNGNVNIITTIKLNNIPFRAIANNFYNVTEILESYMKLENSYRHYTYHTEFIKI